VLHGHTIFSKQLGSTGTSINVKGLSDSINRWNTGEVAMGRPKANLVIFGHTHCHAEFTTFDGVRVLVSPSMSGLDNYAYSLGINTNQAAQPIFESTKNHIYGDSRLVNVLLADKDTTLDKIIPTYDGALNYE
jgi:predicted phosphodiesterase